MHEQVRSGASRRVFREVEPEDLIKFGLIPELVGACRWSPRWTSSTEDALVQILTEPKNALVKSSTSGCSDGRRRARRSAGGAGGHSPRKALQRKTGARGLRSIMEASLIDTMFDLPNLDGVAKVVVDEARSRSKPKPSRRCWSTAPGGQGERPPGRCAWR